MKVYKQEEVGFEGYDAGAEELKSFFKTELKQYLTDDLLPIGRRIIEACLNDATIEEYNEIVPMSFEYEYLFTKMEHLE